MQVPPKGVVKTLPARRYAGFLAALLLAAGLVLMQVFIGGRVQLFSFPGYCFIGAAGVVALAFSSRSKARADSLCLYGTAIFLGYILTRALATPGYFARPDLFSALGALVVYGLTVTVVTSSTIRSAVVAGLLAFSLVHVLIGLIQFSRGDNYMLIPFLQRVDYGQRASGFYVCPNHLAGLLEVVGIFGISLICWGRWPIWAKLLVGYATIVCYVGLALTGSRGGYLSMMASILAFALLSVFVMRSARPRRWLKFAAVTFVALVGLFLVASVLIKQSGYLSQRAGNIIDTKNMRVELWRAALHQWQLQPWIGTGSGTYRFYGRQFRAEQMQNDPIDVHNDYLHLLCEYGMIGAAGFLLFFSAHLRQGWRNFRAFVLRAASSSTLLSNRLALNIGAFSAIAAYVVHSVVDFNLHIPANAMLLAFVFGLIACGGLSLASDAPRPALFAFPRIMTASLGVILLFECGRLFRGEYYAEQARVALRDENPAASIVLANKALEHERENPELYFYLGRALIASANTLSQPQQRSPLFEGAIAAFERAHQLAPLDGTYPLDLAFTYDEIGRFDEAEQMYDAARSRDPRSAAVTELYRAHLESWAKSEPTPNPPL